MRRSTPILLFALFFILAAALPAAARTATVVPPTPTPETTAEAQPVELIPVYGPEVLTVYPHDTGSFTQGLVWIDGTLYESAGRYGQSNLREVDLATGEVIRSVPVSETYFAEGLALVDDRLIQITWREGTAFVYDAATFEVIDQFSYEGEGWGLCYDGVDLWMSDGTPNLFRRDPVTFALLETIPVTLFNEPIANLNELECVDGHVYANIWQSDFIVRITPETGLVNAIIDARGLLTPQQRAMLPGGAVLNGIAYRPDSETFLITGKLWPVLFEVTFRQVGEFAPRG
jgi:glutaminyl-peptide cyclotransferase